MGFIALFLGCLLLDVTTTVILASQKEFGSVPSICETVLRIMDFICALYIQNNSTMNPFGPDFFFLGKKVLVIQYPCFFYF